MGPSLGRYCHSRSNANKFKDVSEFLLFSVRVLTLHSVDDVIKNDRRYLAKYRGTMSVN